MVLPQQVLRASAGVTGSRAQAIDGDKEEVGYKTFLGHLFDLLEEKINTDRYEEGVRQLVGNRVRRDALPLLSHTGRAPCTATVRTKRLFVTEDKAARLSFRRASAVFCRLLFAAV